MMRPQLLLALALLAMACRPAAAVISTERCNTLWVLDWTTAATYGPIFMCGGRPNGNSTVVFKWSGTEDRGLFQVPTDACPKDFTGFATDAYKELAPVSKQGQYAWAVPQETGDYWITSQAGTDCADGLKAQIRVISGSSGRWAASQVLAVAVAAALLSVL